MLLKERSNIVKFVMDPILKNNFSSHKCEGSTKSRGLSKIIVNSPDDFTDQFREDLIHTFREDDPSQACRTDKTWFKLGLEEYRKLGRRSDKHRQNKLRFRTYMNHLALIFKYFERA